MRFILFVCLMMSPWLQAQDFRLDARYPTFSGDTVSLKNIIGRQPVYLKFWATWCLDCRRELPHLQKTYELYHDKIAMFAVNLNINETYAAIAQLQQESGLTMPIVMDQNGSIASNFNFVGTPFHVLINKQGQVVYTTYRDDAKLANKLQQLSADQAPIIATDEAVSSAIKSDIHAEVQAISDYSLLYFSAVWCDSYMVDVEPNIARNCANSVSLMQQFTQAHPGCKIQGWVTHLWTDVAEIAEYKKRLNLPFSVKMDEKNQLFQYYKAKGYPTLIVLKQGKEVARFDEFSEPKNILQQLENCVD